MSSDAQRKADEEKRIEAIDTKIQEAENARIAMTRDANPIWASMDYMEFRTYLARQTNHYE